MASSRLTVLSLAALVINHGAAAAQKENAGRLTVPGIIDCPQSRVMAGATGRVAKVHAEEGTVVKAGDVLAELEDPECDAELRLAEAELTLALAVEKEFVATKGGKVDESPAKEQLARLNAQVKVAEARLNLVKTRAAARTVRSTIDGIVGSRLVEPGSYTRRSESELFRVVDLSRPQLVVEVHERDIAKLGKNSKCSIRVDAIPDLQLTGDVIRIEPIRRSESQSTRVIVSVNNSDTVKGKLKPGMTAQVEFGTEGKK